jgi:hypothetical protein
MFAFVDVAHCLQFAPGNPPLSVPDDAHGQNGAEIDGTQAAIPSC